MKKKINPAISAYYRELGKKSAKKRQKMILERAKKLSTFKATNDLTSTNERV